MKKLAEKILDASKVTNEESSQDIYNASSKARDVLLNKLMPLVNKIKKSAKDKADKEGVKSLEGHLNSADQDLDELIEGNLDRGELEENDKAKNVNEEKRLGGYIDDVFGIRLAQNSDSYKSIELTVMHDTAEEDFSAILNEGYAGADKDAKKLAADIEKAFSEYFKKVDKALS